MTTFHVILLGVAGGTLPDILRIIKERYGDAPKYLGSWFFWMCLALLACVGGLASFLVEPKGVAEALAVGFSAPEILSKLLSKSSDRGVDDTSLATKVRNWWAV